MNNPDDPNPIKPDISQMIAAAESENQLNLLAIFHYVVGGLVIVFGCFPMLHVISGVIMISVPVWEDDPETLPLVFMGVFFVVIGLFVMSMFWTLGCFLIYGGRCLQHRRRWTLCLVVAACACMFMPFGTILGVFTIIVLNRPVVRTMFGQPSTFHQT